MFGLVFGTLGFGQNDVDLALARAATANPRPLGAAVIGTIPGLETVLPGCLGAAPILGAVA